MTTATKPDRTRDRWIRTPSTARLQASGPLDERALFALLGTENGERARDALVDRFLPLARSIARRYSRAADSLDDLTQVASLGLVKAIDRFDPTRDVAFSSYAVPTIAGEIKRYFRDRTWAVRPPRDLQELTLRVDRAISECAETLHRQPSVSEIAEAAGADQEDVLEALQASGAYRAVSFDAPRPGSDDGVAAATLGDSLGLDEAGFDRAEDRATLQLLMATISQRERDVLRMRFEEDMTQAEIGAVIGVSQMQVSRIIRQALERLRLATQA